MTARIVQLVARLLTVGFGSAATFVLGTELTDDQQATLAGLAAGVASAIVAVFMFLTDLAIHRASTGGVLKSAGQTKARSIALLLGVGAMLPFAVGVVGCAPKGTVGANEIRPAVEEVSLRHDRYVYSDDTLTPEDRATYLRTSEMLRATVNAAADPIAVPSP